MSEFSSEALSKETKNTRVFGKKQEIKQIIDETYRGLKICLLAVLITKSTLGGICSVKKYLQFRVMMLLRIQLDSIDNYQIP